MTTKLTTDDFLQFAVERHRIWGQRQAGAAQPWTDDPILATRKFTNVFRVLDPGTQFILTDLVDPDISPRDQLMRLFLYRHTGRVEPWQYLDITTGYPKVGDLEDVRAAWAAYRGGVGRKINFFTGAYKVSAMSTAPGSDKLDSVLELTKKLFTPGSPDDVMPGWLAAKTQPQRFKILQSNKGVGDFMSMQILTDWGYQCGEDREEEFLMPGPGSRKGAKALDPNARTMQVVKRVVEALREMPDCPRLGYRTPSLMDIGSNLLCEWSKYVRHDAAGKTPPKIYQPAHPGSQPAPVLPDYYDEDLL